MDNVSPRRGRRSWIRSRRSSRPSRESTAAQLAMRANIRRHFGLESEISKQSGYDLRSRRKINTARMPVTTIVVLG